MAESGFVQAIVIVLGLIVLVVVCSLFKSRPRPEALTASQLDEMRIRRESAKEAILEDKARRLQDRARIHRHNRLIITARKDTDRLLQDGQEQWDARGRSLYGDAWDTPEDGNLPLRTLFNLPKEEIDSLREEASKLLQTEWRTAGITSSLPAPPEHDRFENRSFRSSRTSGVQMASIEDADTDEHRARTASARRGPSSSRPFPGAPYVDERFVNVPPPTFVPKLDFSGLNKCEGSLFLSPYLESKPQLHTTACATGGGISRDGSPNDGNLQEDMPTRRLQRTQGAEGLRPENKERLRPENGITSALSTTPSVVSDTFVGGRYSPRQQYRGRVITASIQEPGLTHPKPPEVPIPRARKGSKDVHSGQESLSARLARLAGGGNSGRVVPLDLV